MALLLTTTTITKRRLLSSKILIDHNSLSLSSSSLINRFHASSRCTYSTTTPITKSGSDEEKQVLFHLDTKEQQTLPTNNKAADGEVIIPPNIGILTLNRPNAANAFSQRMVSELRAVLDQIRFQENDVRCVVLTSSSSKVFSAGADLKERSSMTQDEAGDFVSQLRGTFDDIANLPMPVVAAIEGVAVGGGLGE
mmetsp:Transcript_28389/g.41989  ORF Transcript_28389/g.41989 Transcript_28389/m.41989 type:complete len:195 (+) Transcript_28389:77-661(+)